VNLATAGPIVSY